jgi:hypothetical protein
MAGAGRSGAATARVAHPGPAPPAGHGRARRGPARCGSSGRRTRTWPSAARATRGGDGWGVLDVPCWAGAHVLCGWGVDGRGCGVRRGPPWAGAHVVCRSEWVGVLRRSACVPRGWCPRRTPAVCWSAGDCTRSDFVALRVPACLDRLGVLAARFRSPSSTASRSAGRRRAIERGVANPPCGVLLGLFTDVDERYTDGRVITAVLNLIIGFDRPRWTAFR